MWIKKLTAMKRISFSQLLKIQTSLKSSHVRPFTVNSCLRDKIDDKTPNTEAKGIKKSEPSEKAPKPYVVEEKDKEVVEDLKKGNILYPYKTVQERVFKIISNDIRAEANKLTYTLTGLNVGKTEVEYFPRHTDVVIIGSGPIGVMTAFQIRNQFPFGPNILVIDRDSAYPHASTNLGQGTLLQQNFIENEEIQMNKYCTEFLSTFHRLTEVDGKPQFSVNYEPMGGLLLANESNVEEVLRKSSQMKSNEIHHIMLDRESLQLKFPWLNLDGVLFGCLGLGNEGLFNPWSFLIGLKCKAYNLGVTFVQGDVVDIAVENSTPVRLIVRLPDGSYNSIQFCYCVLACGMDTLKITEILNNTDMSSLKVKLPLERRKRYEYCLYNPEGPGMNTPIVIDSDGTYFRREGLTGHYVAGVPSVIEDESDKVYRVFEEKVKPFLVKRVKDFEKFEIINGWADSFEINTANSLGILGRHPGDDKIVYACGFTHQGLQYVPAVGRGLMENMFYDKYQTIDFTSYHVENMYLKQHLKAEEEKKQLLAARQRAAALEE